MYIGNVQISDALLSQLIQQLYVLYKSLCIRS